MHYGETTHRVGLFDVFFLSKYILFIVLAFFLLWNSVDLYENERKGGR